MDTDHQPDPDADLMARARSIVDEECAFGHCPDVRLCDLVGKLAVRVARMEWELQKRKENEP